MEEGAVAAPWCPGCLRQAGQAARCPACGLRQHGAAAGRLRVVVRRLYDLGRAQRELATEAAALEAERHRLLAELAAPAAARASREWRPDVVRGLLLGLGALLVALAALIFSVVAWVRLGDLGRAGLLAGGTLAAATGACPAAAGGCRPPPRRSAGSGWRWRWSTGPRPDGRGWRPAGRRPRGGRSAAPPAPPSRRARAASWRGSARPRPCWPRRPPCW
jgi:hypothetical protein